MSGGGMIQYAKISKSVYRKKSASSGEKKRLKIYYRKRCRHQDTNIRIQELRKYRKNKSSIKQHTNNTRLSQLSSHYQISKAQCKKIDHVLVLDVKTKNTMMMTDNEQSEQHNIHDNTRYRQQPTTNPTSNSHHLLITRRRPLIQLH